MEFLFGLVVGLLLAGVGAWAYFHLHLQPKLATFAASVMAEFNHLKQKVGGP